MSKILTITGVIICGLTGPLTMATAQEMPNSDKLSAIVSQNLPGYWQVKQFRLIRASESGDALTPVALVRFEADVEPTKPLFKETGDIVGIFPVIVMSNPVGKLRTLYGTMKLQYGAGIWSGPVSIENPVDNLGQPVDLFPTPVVELGTERQEQMRKLLSTNAVADLTAKLAARLVALQTLNEQQIKQLRDETKLKMKSLKGVREDFIQSQNFKLDELRQKFSQEKIRLVESQKQQLARLKSTASPELDALRQLQLQALADLKSKNQAEIEALQVQHAKKRGAINARQAEKISELEVGFDARLKSLRKQISDSVNLMAMQDTMAKSLQKQARNYANLTQLGNNLAGARKRSLQSFVGVWSGTLSCDGYRITFTGEKVLGNGISGTAELVNARNKYKVTALMNFRDAPLKYPVAFDFLMQFKYTNGPYSGEINANKTMVGLNKRKKCQIRMAKN